MTARRRAAISDHRVGTLVPTVPTVLKDTVGSTVTRVLLGSTSDRALWAAPDDPARCGDPLRHFSPWCGAARARASSGVEVASDLGVEVALAARAAAMHRRLDRSMRGATT
jgi:hypothetical protein